MTQTPTPPPTTQQPVQPRPRVSSLCVLSLVTGIAGFLSVFGGCFCGAFSMGVCSILSWPVQFLLALAAIICGHVGHVRARRGEVAGGGMGVAGFILGYVTLLVTLALAILLALGIAFTEVSGTFGYNTYP